MQGAEQDPAPGCGLGSSALVQQGCEPLSDSAALEASWEVFGFQLWLWKMPGLPSFACALADVSQISLTWLECPAATLALCLTPSNFVGLDWRGTAAFGKKLIMFFWILKLTYQWAPRNHCLKQTFQNSDGSLSFKLYIYIKKKLGQVSSSTPFVSSVTKLM